MKSLKEAAEVRGHSFWGRGPDNTESYNSTPHGTGFFRDGGDYDSYYGRFFLNWYSRVLIDHGDRVLSMANLAFEGNCIAAKVKTKTKLYREKYVFSFPASLNKIVFHFWRVALRYTLVV